MRWLGGTGLIKMKQPECEQGDVRSVRIYLVRSMFLDFQQTGFLLPLEVTIFSKYHTLYRDDLEG